MMFVIMIEDVDDESVAVSYDIPDETDKDVDSPATVLGMQLLTTIATAFEKGEDSERKESKTDKTVSEAAVQAGSSSSNTIGGTVISSKK